MTSSKAPQQKLVAKFSRLRTGFVLGIHLISSLILYLHRGDTMINREYSEMSIARLESMHTPLVSSRDHGSHEERDNKMRSHTPHNSLGDFIVTDHQLNSTSRHISQHHHSLTNTQANNLLGTHDLNTRLRNRCDDDSLLRSSFELCLEKVLSFYIVDLWWMLMDRDTDTASSRHQGPASSLKLSRQVCRNWQKLPLYQSNGEQSCLTPSIISPQAVVESVTKSHHIPLKVVASLCRLVLWYT
ncbi:hypothetical protein Bca4012_101121 [Brassica carinata]